MKLLSVLLSAALILGLASCSTHTTDIPRAFQGRWDTDELTRLVAVEMRRRVIWLIYEDGSTESCRVESVLIKPAGSGQYLAISCGLKHYPKRLMCGAEPPAQWVFELKAGNLGDPDQIEFEEWGDCNGSHKLGPLFRHKAAR